MTPDTCPERQHHGNPFRYCPVPGCGWTEPTPEPEPTPRLADVLPPRARRITYAVLLFIIGIVPAAAVLADGFQVEDLAVIVPAVVSAGGFGMARANVEVPDAES